ncbi:hypothetical protein PV328_009412 [Microctonus aethiopoides]|uniref:Uncharacterized protein n=1 Tax=Microctonus aethiopoides TaxID=144406 RepID=A0AA39C6J1_9HYME|nr:hypothetical protein PV328_009412 [Microctonus aethiopoides]
MNSMKELSLSIEAYDYNYPPYCIEMTGAEAIDIQTMGNLWRLKFDRFSFEANELEVIVSNQSISHLTLKMCRFKECINLITNFSGLKYLNLKYVEEVDNNFLIRLVENCKELNSHSDTSIPYSFLLI